MKRVLMILLLLTMACLAPGCVREAEPEPELPNPVHESTSEEILKTLGITFNLPSDAEDVAYHIIDMEEGSPVAETLFTQGVTEVTYRIRPLAQFEDISGMYYDWKTVTPVEVSYCSGEVRFIEGEQGICLWYDTVPGLMYSIAVENGATGEMLHELANELYVPAKDIP